MKQGVLAKPDAADQYDCPAHDETFGFNQHQLYRRHCASQDLHITFLVKLGNEHTAMKPRARVQDQREPTRGGKETGCGHLTTASTPLIPTEDTRIHEVR